jgi:hypothetical protein
MSTLITPLNGSVIELPHYVARKGTSPIRVDEQLDHHAPLTRRIALIG